MHSTLKLNALLFAAIVGVSSPAVASHPASIQFDLSPVAPAQPVAPNEDVFVPPGYRWVRVRLDISSLINTAEQSKPHEFVYRIQCSSPDSRVVDYSPRTQLSASTVGGIRVEQSDEKSKSLGLALKGSYLNLVDGSSGADLGSKVCNKTTFEKAAPQEILFASGTIARGQGVYFKLRATPAQVLDGQKPFTITLQVPDSWRGDLMSVHLDATESHRSFGGLERESSAASPVRFQVAVYDQADDIARRWAWQLAEAEQRLREASTRYASSIRERSLPTIFHHVAAALDVIEPRISEDWMQRALYGSIDPYFDKQIRQLPVAVKVAVLDYVDAKTNFEGLVRSASISQEAHSGLAVN
ncbi:hypothetical protein Poly24_53570 [Rosistilla carotiformis]|uniref:Uncharacterized protein n=1 Tax=Rosistilla carotiformis TaxID=2528017 RepID=A0A518K1D4_9BACT|nr:hypothetical protein [Rosistilla carotiformis]QDV71618.1 hypothetical protein Poly24_53570 [Rosistilla carotiformis]